MTRMVPLVLDSQDATLTSVFQEIQQAFGRVPNLFRVYAHHPPLLRANWDKVKAVMMGGHLRREVKETIALLVSKDNGCDYCVAAHSAALRSLGVSEEQITALQQSLEAFAFAPREAALIDFARQANCNPHAITDAQFRAVRDTGAEDAEIIEALGVMEIFAGFNRFLDSLQVDVDF